MTYMHTYMCHIYVYTHIKVFFGLMDTYYSVTSEHSSSLVLCLTKSHQHDYRFNSKLSETGLLCYSCHVVTVEVK
jgi:hypothetical protein